MVEVRLACPSTNDGQSKMLCIWCPHCNWNKIKICLFLSSQVWTRRQWEVMLHNLESHLLSKPVHQPAVAVPMQHPHTSYSCMISYWQLPLCIIYLHTELHESLELSFLWALSNCSHNVHVVMLCSALFSCCRLILLHSNWHIMSWNSV